MQTYTTEFVQRTRHARFLAEPIPTKEELNRALKISEEIIMNMIRLDLPIGIKINYELVVSNEGVFHSADIMRVIR